ncbi:MAG: hypothetical protein JW819_07010 [Candidatus Krumholzibacteriota bacterium]|nr:hypothetical protein [Candidatus Krumholzibacteriota bacterium]
MRTSALGIGVALLLLASAQLLGPNRAARLAREEPPLSGWLMGSQDILVDYFWFDLLQYYGAYALGEGDLAEFVPRTERLLRLAPSFHRAYSFAAAVRASNMADPQGALAWLELGEARNPEQWLYPYEQGFINYLQLERYEDAEDDFRRAGSLPGAPPAWRRFVAHIREHGGDPRLAMELWQQVADLAEHPMVREAALENVRRLEALIRAQGGAMRRNGDV